MSRLISAEALKLRSTRTSLVLSLGALAVALGVTAAIGASGEFERSIPAARQVLAAAGVVQIAAGILGILAVTGEFRYGTITPALLVPPDRRRLVLAKLIVLVLAGLALGLLSFGLGAAIERYGFAALSSGLSDTAAADPNADLLAQLPAGLLLAAYAAILLAAGTALLRRRDIA